MIIPRIVPGLELIDDEGDEVAVQRIDASRETVELETSDGDSYSMSLRELRSKLRDGEFAVLDDDDDDDDDDEEDTEDDPDD